MRVYGAVLLVLGRCLLFASDISEKFMSRVLELPIMENPSASEQSIPFADSLVQLGFFSISAEEYERECVLHPTEPVSDYACYQSALCYLKMGNYERADRILDELSYRALRRDVAYRASLLSALIDIRMGYPRAGRAALKVALRDFPEWKAETHFWLGWCYVFNYEWSEAKTEFQEVCSDTGAESYFMARAYGALRYLEICKPGLKERSPYVARWLSAILPGAGHIYAGGGVKEALNSFALNLILGGLTISYFAEKKYLQSAIVFLFGWNRYYFGGVANASMLAERYNISGDEKIAEFLIRTLILEEDDTDAVSSVDEKKDSHEEFGLQHNSISTVAKWGLRLYKGFITGQDVQNCQFKLSCSSFAMRLFEQRNPFVAIIMTSDRLLRCNPFAHHSYPADTSGMLIDYDWWDGIDAGNH